MINYKFETRNNSSFFRYFCIRFTNRLPCISLVNWHYKFPALKTAVIKKHIYKIYALHFKSQVWYDPSNHSQKVTKCNLFWPFFGMEFFALFLQLLYNEKVPRYFKGLFKKKNITIRFNRAVSSLTRYQKSIKKILCFSLEH